MRRILVGSTILVTLAVLAIGRAGEDLCLDDMVERGYGSSVQQGEVVPPRVECVLRGPDDPADPPVVTVGHPVTAAARFAAVVALPIVWLAGLALLVWRSRRRPGTN